MTRAWVIVCGILVATCIGCGGGAPKPKPVDVELANASASARTAYGQGQMAQAATLYDRALVRSRAMDNAGLIADNAYNAAACRIALGQYPAARDLLDEALYEVRRSGGDVSDILLMQAKTAYLQRKSDEAGDIAARAEAALGNTPADAQRAQIILLRGQIAADSNDAATAQKSLDAAAPHIAASKSASLQAAAARLAGRISLLHKQPLEAAAHFDEETNLLREGKMYPEMAESLASAGRAYREASKPAEAADRLLRAARATLAQGDAGDAAKLCAEAKAQAELAHDPALLKRIESIAAQVPATKPSER